MNDHNYVVHSLLLTSLEVCNLILRQRCRMFLTHCLGRKSCGSSYVFDLFAFTREPNLYRAGAYMHSMYICTRHVSAPMGFNIIDDFANFIVPSGEEVQ